MADARSTDSRNELGRPPVSIIIPFRGAPEEATAVLDAVAGLNLRDDDEVVLVENAAEGHLRDLPRRVRRVGAPEQASSYYARNVGSEASSNEWMLFMDADCRPQQDLLDAYFRTGIDADCGAVGGEVVTAERDPLSRYAESRGMLKLETGRNHRYRPLAVTANLLVRRSAWESVGGFLEGIRSGGDADFSWRLQDAGWRLDFRADAVVKHAHRTELRGLIRQVARHASGTAWLDRRHPGSSEPPKLTREIPRGIAGLLIWGILGQRDRAVFKAVDVATATASVLGRLRSNAASYLGADPSPGGVVLFSDAFPRRSEAFVVEQAHALVRQGCRLSIEARVRPQRPARGAVRGLRVRYREDASQLDRLRCGAWLLARHPLRALSDARSQSRWERGGDRVARLAAVALAARRIARSRAGHLHADSATAALDAMRIACLEGLPFSMTTRDSEIFSEPMNLEEKMSKAAFVATDCDYNVHQLRRLGAVPPGRIHRIVPGVDGSRFRRRKSLAGNRNVGTVGRMVEKAGFKYLIEAAGLLERGGCELDRVLIAGDGPLRNELTDLARRHGVAHRVHFLGALEPARIAMTLEELDVFVLPCAVDPSGDRDSMPAAIKEAMAMELPIVGSDEVGLPEMIKPEWGRLTEPRDAVALAAAIAEVLAWPLERRARAGAAAREFVLSSCNADLETEKLARLIGAAADSHGGGSRTG